MDALGPPGQRALQAEREARAAAERRATELEAEAKKLRDAQQTEQQKLEARAAEGDRKAAEAAVRIRHAKLLTALADRGLVGGQGKLAAQALASVVRFDEGTDEPMDLEAAITRAKTEYGEAAFTPTVPAAQPAQVPAQPSSPAAGAIPVGLSGVPMTGPLPGAMPTVGATPPVPYQAVPGAIPVTPPPTPDLHAGPRTPAQVQQEEAALAAFAATHFPQLVPAGPVPAGTNGDVALAGPAV